MCEKKELTDYLFSVWWEKNDKTGTHYLCIKNVGMELVKDVEVFVAYSGDWGDKKDTIGHSQPKDKPYRIQLFTSDEYNKCGLLSIEVYLKYNGKMYIHTISAPRM